MLKKSIFVLTTFIFFLLLSCASPQKSFNKGDYDKAYKLALKNMKKGKKSRKDQTILKKSFNEIMKRQQAVYADYNDSDIIEDWEKAYHSYDDLLEKYDEGKAYLDNDIDMTMVQIEQDLEQLGRDIADNYYSLGEMRIEAFEETKDKLEAQEAYHLYRKSEDYGKDDAELEDKIDYALEQGMLIVLVIAEERWGGRFAYDIDREFRQVEREGRDFTEVIYERNNLDADCTLEVEFSDIDRRVRDSRDTRSFSEQIQDGTESRQDTSGNTIQVPRYITVSADVTITREEVTFRWQARARAYGDRRYCDYRDRTFTAEESLVNELYDIRGDTRAVPSEFRNSRYDNRREEDLIDDLIEEIYRDFERAYF